MFPKYIWETLMKLWFFLHFRSSVTFNTNDAYTTSFHFFGTLPRLCLQPFLGIRSAPCRSAKPADSGLSIVT